MINFDFGSILKLLKCNRTSYQPLSYGMNYVCFKNSIELIYEIKKKWGV